MTITSTQREIMDESLITGRSSTLPKLRGLFWGSTRIGPSGPQATLLTSVLCCQNRWQQSGDVGLGRTSESGLGSLTSGTGLGASGLADPSGDWKGRWEVGRDIWGEGNWYGVHPKVLCVKALLMGEFLEGESTNSPTPWFQTPHLQNYEKINFSCFKPPSL